ncbi:MAG: ankyrin repeat domain-containing protein [Terracidiphilus sp.]|jgi:ankyrin repeat protein
MCRTNHHKPRWGLESAHGVNVETRERDGKTALIEAAFDGQMEAMKPLLSNGAKTEDTDNRGQTALIWTAEFDQVSAAKLLLSQGANIHAKDKQGQTALHWSVIVSGW